MSPNTVATVAAISSGAPTRPMAGMKRGTSRDRYSRVPSSSALSAAHDAGAEQERPVADGDQRLAGGQEAGVVRAGGAGDVLRRVTTASRLTTPTMMTAASTCGR